MNKTDQFKELYKCRSRLDEVIRQRKDVAVSIRKEKRDRFLESRRNQFAYLDVLCPEGEIFSEEERKTLVECTESTSDGSHILRKLILKFNEAGSSQFLVDAQLLPILFRIFVENSHDSTNSLAYQLIISILFNRNVDEHDCGIVTILDGMLSHLKDKNCNIHLMKQILQSLKSGCVASLFVAEILVEKGIFDIFTTLIDWHAQLFVTEQVLIALSGFFSYFLQEAKEVEVKQFAKCIEVSLTADSPRLASCGVYTAYLASDFPVFTQVLEKLIGKMLSLFPSLPDDCFLCFAKFLTNIFSNCEPGFADFNANEMLGCVSHLLKQPNKMVKIHTCYVLTFLVTDNGSNAQMLMQSECISILLDIIDNADFDTRREACYVINCLIRTNIPIIVSKLLDMRVIPRLVDLLTVMDLQLVDEVLSSIETLLAYGEDISATSGYPDYAGNDVLNMFEECNGKERLEFLGRSNNFEIQLKACEILDRFCGDDHCDVKEIDDILSSVVSQICNPDFL